MTWTAKKPVDLERMAIIERKSALPAYLGTLIERAKSKKLNVNTIWIYGSRARGDARENSDFDLAFKIGNQNLWSSFVVEIAEDPPSLHGYDLVDIDRVDASLRAAILREGIIIYESR